MKVKEIMSKKVASLNSEDSVERAAQLMKQYDVGSIPVCSRNQVVGIVTDRDIAVRTIAEGKDSKQEKVSAIMSSNPVVGNPDMDVHDAAKIMSTNQIRRLPIVENNNLVGILALGDISVEPELQDNAEQTLRNISQPCESKM
ncbi:CBS domain-containing protein [Caproiciproducens galactitolivorans]|uniref:Hypoxic response protein 1 n=1 Tax=Caproiciproducens galactitolivorans TaxID=642589 RepID=A0A4Z0YE28_9FIRM|nr:CBS domain-containing protein [Caproiciproducens galactitolivorans]QEY34740.1 CBS domain-containing protein [Caproiciproducens galactitolivorans]TGJ76016.1 hypoxic response protein 1 [Caproiciproducens galactitolivorans]